MKYKKLFVLLIIFVLIILFIFYPREENGLVIVSDGDVLPDKICNQIQDRDFVIHKLGCSACAVAIPRLEKINEDPNFELEFFDLAVVKDRNEILDIAVYIYPASTSFYVVHDPLCICVSTNSTKRNSNIT